MFNQHLTHEERSTIASLKRNNCSNAEIAAMTDRHRTGVCGRTRRQAGISTRTCVTKSAAIAGAARPESGAAAFRASA